MIELTQEMVLIVLLVLTVAVIVLFILCIVLFVKFGRQKKRYDFFMGANRRPSHNLEMKIEEYYETSKRIEEKYSKLLDMVTDMDQTDKSKIQKVGLIRYNPFDEMGGNLCFALALLDGKDNGVVLNGIHSRTGSFTYAKPIEMGVSTYMLSEEEIKAVEMAKNNSYEPEHQKVVKVRFKPTFKRKDKKDKQPAIQEQITLDQVEMVEVDKAEEKTLIPPRRPSIGDVTQAEKELILKEETLAGKIAAAETILKMREEARAAEARAEEKEENLAETIVAPASKAEKPVAKAEKSVSKAEKPVTKAENAAEKVEKSVGKIEKPVAKAEKPVEETSIPEPAFVEPIFMEPVFLEKFEEEEIAEEEIEEKTKDEAAEE